MLQDILKDYLNKANEFDWRQLVDGDSLLRNRVSAIYVLMAQLWGPERMVSRANKMEVLELVDHKDLTKKVLGLQKLLLGDPTLEEPRYDEIPHILDLLAEDIAEMIARRSVEERLERMVHERMHERQDDYMREIKLNLLKEENGPETEESTRKLQELEALERRLAPLAAAERMRPQKLDEVIGQEQAKKAMMAKLATPFPPHILLYGPPGVGKTTVARLVLQVAKALPNSAFGADAPFIEVDGTTLRWDPREITNPLLGSVHDPIYQGARRDLADGAVPEPKPGLVTDAHGGILFIDEIGEMDPMLQAKLLKVLEDKRVRFESSYYDSSSPNIPSYIRKLFKDGAPANFVLIGATTRAPEQINPAIRSRCAEVFFDPMNRDEIILVVKGAAKRLRMNLEAGVAELIADHADEARRAVSILADVYGLTLYASGAKLDRRRLLPTGLTTVQEALQISRLAPNAPYKAEETPRIGKVFGVGAYGFLGSALEIEAISFPSHEPGKGVIRFNDTAGSMAKDSVFVAAAVIRKLYNLNLADFDVHVNVVGGGNVDGPSAGAALTVAIASAVRQVPVRQDVAITGEISLHGRLKPVGGLYGKAYGAKQAGMKELLLPQENAQELREEIVGIPLVPLQSIEEVLQRVLVS
ncbi:MAG: Lon family ATP-dependent protease [Symbiobacteriaceae bacterium]|nr:Lon family ATP-dependent protease [Symbiobacteriaceae bacterium]